MKRTLMALAFVVFGGIALAGPQDNSLVIGTSQEPVSIGSDPLATGGSQAIRSEMELYTSAGLYRTNLEAELEPELVTEVATVENGRLRIMDGADGNQRVEMELTLRDDIFWSDGQPITTDDIQLVYEMSQTPGMPLASPDYWERFSMEVVDERNFIVALEPAQSSDLVGSPIGLLPAHVMRSAWEEVLQTTQNLNPETDAERLAEAYKAFFVEFGSPEAINAGRNVYSGPFVPVRWTPGSTVEMTRNPHYFAHPENQENYVQTVRYRFITDTNALVVAILGGGIDATSSVAITFDQARSPQIASRAPGRFDIWFVPGAIWEHVEVNQFPDVQQVSDLMLDDLRTRQALLHSIDRQGMVDALFDGLQPVAHTNVNPADPNYTEEGVRQYEYNPERAAELFTELGWERGPDGILQRTTEDGRTVRFEMEFTTTAGNATRERQQQFIAEDLRQAGVEVRINNAPSNVVFAPEFINRAVEGAWTSFMFAWISSQASSLNQAGYICEAAPRPENNFAGQNVAGACMPEYDEVRERAVRELDLEAARPLYHELQRLFSEHLHALPLFYRSNPLVTSLGLNNYVTSTFSQGFGYPPVRPELVGWEQNGAEQFFNQADYALTLE
jgi:peptide/nickel transport system substrate-binding protein